MMDRPTPIPGVRLFRSASQARLREYEILRIAGALEGTAPAEAAKAVRIAVLQWIASGRKLPNDAWQHGNFDAPQGGRNCAALRLDVDGVDTWAVRVEDPDKYIPGRTWVNEVVVAHEADQVTLFSLRQQVHTGEIGLDVEPAVPRFVISVVRAYQVRCGSQILGLQPERVDTASESDGLVERLVSPERTLPYVVATVSDDANETLLGVSQLARSLVGLAHVVVVAAPAAWRLTERLGKVRSVFGGAARVYLPGFGPDSYPFSHQLFVADRLGTAAEQRRVAQHIRQLAADLSVRRLVRGRDVVTYADIREMHNAALQERLERTGASDKRRLEAAHRHITDLSRQLTTERQLQEYFSEEYERALTRAEAAEDQLRGANHQLGVLRSRLREATPPRGEPTEAPNSWTDLLAWCNTEAAGLVSLTPRARRDLESGPLFRDVAQASRCLEWLAGECRSRYLGGPGGSLRDFALEEGIRNSPCGKDAFEFDWQGRRYTADWHIKNGGNTRDPTRCLRIYYTWDVETELILVASMPAHIRTGAT